MYCGDLPVIFLEVAGTSLRNQRRCCCSERESERLECGKRNGGAPKKLKQCSQSSVCLRPAQAGLFLLAAGMTLVRSRPLPPVSMHPVRSAVMCTSAVLGEGCYIAPLR